MTMTNSNTAALGNTAHAVTIVSTLLFAVTVATSFSHVYSPFGLASLLDDKWKLQGFCITNETVPYWSSHDACLYLDCVAGAILFVTYLSLGKNNPSMKRANMMIKTGIPGIIFHGVGHGALASGMRDSGYAHDNLNERPLDQLVELFESKSLFQLVFRVIPLLLFWVFLLRSSMPNVKSWVTVISLAVAMLTLQLFFPFRFGFTYVQTVLLIVFSTNQILLPRNEKDQSYALYGWMVSVPVSLVGWMESTQCSSFVMDRLYGHLVYDGYIPVAILGWYLGVYHFNMEGGNEKIKVV